MEAGFLGEIDWESCLGKDLVILGMQETDRVIPSNTTDCVVHKLL